VQPTLFVFGKFPPPSAGTNVLSRFDRSGARGASDRGEPPVVEEIVGDIVFFDILPHLLFVPMDERVYFEKTVIPVPLNRL
jgi:hypothetical protein